MASVSLFRGNLARVLAILALIAGVSGASVPGFSAVMLAQPTAMHPATACDNGSCDAPMHHLPAADCCVTNLCVMSLVLPTAPSDVVLPALPEPGSYALPALQQPDGIITAPIPHPPKSAA